MKKRKLLKSKRDGQPKPTGEEKEFAGLERLELQLWRGFADLAELERSGTKTKRRGAQMK
jgi:hypothetical protein